jgi:hypothetical protein
MAVAELNYSNDLEDGTVYEVQTDPCGDPPFSGPDDRNWNNLVVGGMAKARNSSGARLTTEYAKPARPSPQGELA